MEDNTNTNGVAAASMNNNGPAKRPPEDTPTVDGVAQAPKKKLKVALDKKDKKALKDYTGDGYVVINQALRSGSISPQVGDRVDNVIIALDKLKDTTTYKGIVIRGSVMTSEILESWKKENPTFQDPGFLSASKDEKLNGYQQSENPLSFKFIITSKSGQYIAKYSRNKFEEEVLFRPDTKFRIHRVDWTLRRVYMEEILEDEEVDGDPSCDKQIQPSTVIDEPVVNPSSIIPPLASSTTSSMGSPIGSYNNNVETNNYGSSTTQCTPTILQHSNSTGVQPAFGSTFTLASSGGNGNSKSDQTVTATTEPNATSKKTADGFIVPAPTNPGKSEASVGLSNNQANASNDLAPRADPTVGRRIITAKRPSSSLSSNTAAFTNGNYNDSWSLAQDLLASTGEVPQSLNQTDSQAPTSRNNKKRPATSFTIASPDVCHQNKRPKPSLGTSTSSQTTPMVLDKSHSQTTFNQQASVTLPKKEVPTNPTGGHSTHTTVSAPPLPPQLAVKRPPVCLMPSTTDPSHVSFGTSSNSVATVVASGGEEPVSSSSQGALSSSSYSSEVVKYTRTTDNASASTPSKDTNTTIDVHESRVSATTGKENLVMPASIVKPHPLIPTQNPTLPLRRPQTRSQVAIFDKTAVGVRGVQNLLLKFQNGEARILDWKRSDGYRTGSYMMCLVGQTGGIAVWFLIHEITECNKNYVRAALLADYADTTYTKISIDDGNEARKGKTKIVAIIELSGFRGLKNFHRDAKPPLSQEKKAELCCEIETKQKLEAAGRRAPKDLPAGGYPMTLKEFRASGGIICGPEINCVAASMASCAVDLDKSKGGHKYPNTKATVDYIVSKISPEGKYASNGDLIDFVKGETYNNGKPVFGIGRLNNSYHNNPLKILSLQGVHALIRMRFKQAGDDLRLPFPLDQYHCCLLNTDLKNAKPGVLGIMLDNSKGNKPQQITAKDVSSKPDAKKFFYDFFDLADEIEITDTYCIYPHGECPPSLEGEFGPELFGMTSSKVKRRRAHQKNQRQAQGHQNGRP